MKTKLIYPLALLFVYTLNMNAQEKGSAEFKLGVAGLFTSNQVVSFVSDIIVYPATLGNVSMTNQKYFPAFYFDYNYAVMKRWTLGLTGIYEKITKDINDGSDQRVGNQMDNHYTIALTTNYHYISGRAFRLYSGLGLGYTMLKSSFTSSNAQVLADNTNGSGYLNYQITALGFRVGRDLAVHAELGFGYKGILNAGLNYQF